MDRLEAYLRDNSTPLPQALEWLERQTHLRTNHARMLSGRTVGALLRELSLLQRPHHILELGTFTGYSAICLASGLEPDGILDTLELNDELEDLIVEGFDRAGLADRINLIFGDAKELIPGLPHTYDMVYIDANKREYTTYFELIMRKVRPGALIIADNVLWDGKVLEEHPDSDAQTQGIIAFNRMVAADPRVENFILPLRDGLNVIRVK